MWNLMIVAGLLLFSGNVRAEELAPAKCSAAEVKIFTGELPRKKYVLELDADGAWFFQGWEEVHAMALEPAAHGMPQCIAQWLLNHKSTARVTSKPNFRCPNIVSDSDELNRVWQSDPAISSCQPAQTVRIIQ